MASSDDFFLFLPIIAGGGAMGITSTLCGIGVDVLPLILSTGVAMTSFVVGPCLKTPFGLVTPLECIRGTFFRCDEEGVKQ